MEIEALAVLRDDPVLDELIQRHGEFTLEPADDSFQRLVTSVIRQQLSMDSAAAIRERVFSEFEVSPQGLLDASRDDLVETGLSSSKAEYLHCIANAYIENGYDDGFFSDMSDEEVIRELTSIKGVGDWTAKMYLIFCLGRRDVFPIEDLGIRNGMRLLYSDDMSRGNMMEVADAWRPYRSYGSMYIWHATEE